MASVSGEKVSDTVTFEIIIVHDVAVVDVKTYSSISGLICINVTVKHEGDLGESFNVTAYCNDTAIGMQTLLGLAPEVNITLTFSWNITNVAPGNYTISAKASTVPGETDTADNTYIDGTITVRWPISADPVHDVAVVNIMKFSPLHGPPSHPYIVTECYCTWYVRINVTVENEGDFAESFNVTAYYNETAIGMQAVTDLAPGANTTLTFMWDVPSIPWAYPYPVYYISAEVSVVEGEDDTADNSMVDGSVKVKWIGDVNGDGHVDIHDLTKFAIAWNKIFPEKNYNPQCDFNFDGSADIYDLTKLALNWRKGPIPG